jgi:hypothetical protein
VGPLNILIFVVALAVFIVFGFALNRSIKQHESKKKVMKSKKGRSKYMPEVKKMGR